MVPIKYVKGKNLEKRIVEVVEESIIRRQVSDAATKRPLPKPII